MRDEDERAIRRGPAGDDAPPAMDSEDLQRRVWEAQLADDAQPDFGVHQVTSTSGGYDAQRQTGARALPSYAKSVADIAQHREGEPPEGEGHRDPA